MWLRSSGGRLRNGELVVDMVEERPLCLILGLLDDNKGSLFGR